MNKGQYTIFFEKVYRYTLLLIFKELTPNGMTVHVKLHSQENKKVCKNVKFEGLLLRCKSRPGKSEETVEKTDLKR